MTLKVSLGWSLLFHLGFLSIRPPAGLVPPRETLSSLEVTYLVIPAQPTHSLRAAAPALPPKSGGQAASHLDLPKEPDPAPARRPAASPKPFLPATGSASVRSPLPERWNPPPLPKGAVSMLSQAEFAQVEHKEQVRLHLKAGLRYPQERVEGVVRLRLQIAADGRLTDAAAPEATDPRLAAFTLQQAGACAPFPPFPPAMRSEDASYEFLVKYQSD